MKKLLSVVVPILAAALAGCGAEGKSCTSEPAPLAAVASSCTLQPGAAVSLQVRSSCQRCFHTNPSCRGEIVAGNIELDPVFQECEEDRGCANQSCALGGFSCTFTTPAQSAQYNVLYPGSDGQLATTSIVVATGGQTSCSL